MTASLCLRLELQMPPPSRQLGELLNSRKRVLLQVGRHNTLTTKCFPTQYHLRGGHLELNSPPDVLPRGTATVLSPAPQRSAAGRDPESARDMHAYRQAWGPTTPHFGDHRPPTHTRHSSEASGNHEFNIIFIKVCNCHFGL